MPKRSLRSTFKVKLPRCSRQAAISARRNRSSRAANGNYCSALRSPRQLVAHPDRAIPPKRSHWDLAPNRQSQPRPRRAAKPKKSGSPPSQSVELGYTTHCRFLDAAKRSRFVRSRARGEPLRVGSARRRGNRRFINICSARPARNRGVGALSDRRRESWERKKLEKDDVSSVEKRDECDLRFAIEKTDFGASRAPSRVSIEGGAFSPRFSKSRAFWRRDFFSPRRDRDQETKKPEPRWLGL